MLSKKEQKNINNNFVIQFDNRQYFQIFKSNFCCVNLRGIISPSHLERKRQSGDSLVQSKISQSYQYTYYEVQRKFIAPLFIAQKSFDFD